MARGASLMGIAAGNVGVSGSILTGDGGDLTTGKNEWSADKPTFWMAVIFVAALFILGFFHWGFRGAVAP